MAEQRLSAMVRIGGAVEKSLTKGLLRTSDRLGDIGQSIHEVKKRQSELGRQRKTLIDQGRSVEALDREYKHLTGTLKELETRQRKWRDVAAKSTKVGQTWGTMIGRVGRVARTAAYTIGGVATAIGAVTTTTANAAEETLQWSRRLGVTTKWLSRTQYAAGQYGVQQDAVINGIKELSLRADEFAETAKGPAAEAFDRLGLSQAEVNELSEDTARLFEVVKGRMTGITNVAARQRIADELFGGTAGEQFAETLGISRQELERLREESDATGNTIDESMGEAARKYNRAFRRMGGAISGLRNMIGAELLPVVTDLFGAMSEWAIENKARVGELASEFVDWFRVSWPNVKSFISGMKSMAVVIGNVVSWVADLVGGFDRLGMIVVGLFAGKALISIGAFGLAVAKLGITMGTLAATALPAVAAGIKAIGMALFANPIGLVIGAIAGAAFLVYKYWDPISDWFSGVWDDMKGAASGAIEWLKGLLEWPPLATFSKAWAPLTDWFGGLWDGIKAKAGAALDWIRAKIEWVGDAIETAKGWVGMGSDDDESVMDSPRPSGAGSVAGAQQYVAGQKSYQQIKQEWKIDIHQQPGQDAQDVADEIERRQRDQMGGALYDGPTTFSGAAGY